MVLADGALVACAGCHLFWRSCRLAAVAGWRGREQRRRGEGVDGLAHIDSGWGGRVHFVPLHAVCARAGISVGG